MPCYDTLKLWLPNYEVPECDLLAEIPLKLTERVDLHNHNKAEEIVLGYHRNLRVSVRARGVSIEGSANKYLLGQNLETINREQTKEYIESISDEFNLPFHLAKVSRIDFSDNMEMKYKPETYVRKLGNARYFKRYQKDIGLTYHKANCDLVFYDKIAEMNKTGVAIPPHMKGINFLRYETRIKGGLIKKMFGADFIASALYDEKIYLDLEQFWLKNYEAIWKEPNLNPQFPDGMNTKKFIDRIEVDWYLKQGSFKKAIELIEDLDEQGKFANRMVKSRLKQRIKRAFKNPLNFSENELIAELNAQIQSKIQSQ